ncbi:MAG TPA: MogA/MoaB family molybdenum cofactor biosynthesis protein [Bellilinea sp.]|nr:MogA/MoaB family molybdenum cofactor biosynthesis protein [Bellilinea sp.]
MDTPIRIAILTVSDRASQGLLEDRSGAALHDALFPIPNLEIIWSGIVPDDEPAISEALRNLCDVLGAEVVLTTGGTGLSHRDRTPEATVSVADRLVPGIAEAMRTSSLAITPMGMISRGVAALRGQSLIVNLPGSPKGAVENLQVFLPALTHAVEILRGDNRRHESAG